MSGVVIGLLVFAFLAAAALTVLWLHSRLPAGHRSKETTDIIRLGIGVVATITALVLGLLISSVKGSFDLASRDVQVYATNLILLDRTLRLYGPGAEAARALLTRYTERALEGTWPSTGAAPIVQDPAAEAFLNQAEQAILALQPPFPEPGFKELVLGQIRDVVRQRWTLIGESGSAVSLTIVVAVTLWLGLIFASFGYNAPRNGVTVFVLLVCAASVAGAVFLIMEIDGTVTGMIVVSSEPVQQALAQMRR